MHDLALWIEQHKPIDELAERVECSVPHLRNIIAGRKEPSLGLAMRLSHETGLEVEAFAKRQKSRKKKAHACV